MGVDDLVAGLLLTGGSSRRMGVDKARIVIDGDSLAGRLAAVLLASLRGPVLEVGPGWSGLPTVAEEQPGSGPLVAFAAGAAHLAGLGHAGGILLVACDLPFLTVAAVRFLARQMGTAIPLVGGRQQPLCARYDGGAAPVAARLVAEGARAMAALLDRLDVNWLDESAWHGVADARTFADVDTPEDLVRLGLRP